MDFKGLNEYLLPIVPEWLPGCVREGDEIICANKEGGKGRSFSYNIVKGVWKDFNTGEGGSDPISLWAARENITMGEAYRDLCRKYGWGDDKPIEHKKAPDGASKPSMIHYKHGNPVATWAYCDESGKDIFYVARYEPEEGRKIILPWSWNEDKKAWKVKAPEKPLPIYNLNLLAENPEARVLVVEGEKSADAAAQMIEGVVTTWHGGASRWQNADWAPLRGREVILWPDADEPGVKCMAKLAYELYKFCKIVKIIRVPVDGGGEDAADFLDAGFNHKKLNDWAKERIYDFAPDPEDIPENEDPYLFPLTDTGNVDRLWHWFKDDYIYTSLGWWRWNGKIWQKDAMESMRLTAAYMFDEMVKRAMDDLKRAVSGTPSEKKAKERYKFFRSSQNLNKIKCMMELSQGRFRQPDTIWDANHDLINFENGTMDLKTGKMKSHCKDDYITKSARYAIKLDGDCPTFKKFLFQAMGQDNEKAEFLYKTLGSSMSGRTKDQIILMNHGVGQNGKSTLYDEVMLGVMGDYGKAINIKTFLDSQASRSIGPRPDLISLIGIRYGTMSEPPVGASLDEALIKSFTGGDKVVCRDLHKGNTEFIPSLHLFMSYNLEPRLKDFSYGMLRRIKKLEWPVTFEKNEEFKKELKSEIPSIAWFLVQCCMKWYEEGLTVPEIVNADTKEYFTDQNVISQFVDMKLQRMPGLSISNGDMKKAFDECCEENGWDHLSHKALSKGLKDLGFRQAYAHGGRQRRWQGVAFIESRFDSMMHY